MNKKWYKPSNRPEYSKELDHCSVSVLLYSTDMEVHAIGWFDFSSDKWMNTAEEDFGNEFMWSYLEKPEVKNETERSKIDL